MKLRNLLNLLVILILAWGGFSNAQSTQQSSEESITQNRCEFLVQFKPTATEADRNRVAADVRGIIKKRIGTPEMRALGLPEVDVVAVPFPTKPTTSQIQAVVRRMESDKSVHLAEINHGFTAASP